MEREESDHTVSQYRGKRKREMKEKAQQASTLSPSYSVWEPSPLNGATHVSVSPFPHLVTTS